MGGVLYYQLGSQHTEGEGQSPMQATPVPAVEGDAMAYTGEPFYEALTGFYNEYLSQRSGAGWSTRNVTPGPEISNEEFSLVGADSGLTRFVVSDPVYGEGGAGEALYRNLFLEEGSRAVGSLTPLIPPGVKHLRAPEEFGVFPGGANFGFVPGSRDFSRLFFEADDALLGSGPLVGELEADVAGEIAASERHDYLYEWHAGGLALANILPDGKIAQGARLGFEYGEEEGADLEHVVSESGLRVFWSGEEGAGTGKNLYLRERSEANPEEAKTVEVAAGGSFLGATPDGSRVFYLTAGENALDEYDVATGQTSVIASEGVGVLGGSVGEYGGLVGTGDGGEYVYFVSHAKLPSEPNAELEEPKEGEYNLYAYEPGGGGHVTRFIATLTQTDNQPGDTIGQDDTTPGTPQAVWARSAKQRTSQVSPDGRFLAFDSKLALTAQAEAAASGQDEVYVFDAASGALSCASCDPSGAPNGGAVLPKLWDGAGMREQRYMLDDGALFFSTPSALLVQDENNVDDVYEYREGSLSLISPGDSETPAVFADASEDASDVFFTTAQPLVGQDTDEIADVYDARVEGGLPAPVAPPGDCSSPSPEACHGASPPAPASQAPTSATFTGSGNPTTPTGVVGAGVTRAQKLAKALTACRRTHRHSRKRRETCERAARRAYAARKATRAAKSTGNGGR
jgi:hypothetical protein